MYYRYKSKKKDRRFLKFFIVAALAVTAVYLLYSNKSKFMIWRINQNKIVVSIEEASGIADPVARALELKKLAGELEAYKKENLLDPEAFIMASRLYMKIALNTESRSFSAMYIDDSLTGLSRDSVSALLFVIRDVNRAIALYDGREPEVSDLLAMARASFLTGYYDNNYIYNMVSSRINNGEPVSVEDARFYSLLCIASGRIDEGLDFLSRHGAAEESVEGKLFRARALNDAMKYTEAIIAFQSILKGSEESGIMRTCYLNLGRIYFNQRLYRESLEQYTAALTISSDNNCKIWMGKNHAMLGEKDKAKQVWTEVLTADPSNDEAKQLLAALR